MKRIYIVVIVAAFAGAMFNLPGLGSAKASLNQNVAHDVDPNMPVGTILAYAGKVTGKHRDKLWRAGWLPCDGATIRETEGLPVFEVIHRFWGGDEEKQDYMLPDLRGRFARGVNHKQKKLDDNKRLLGDPEASGRTPSAAGGKGANHVGSIQGYATAPPGNEFSGRTDDGARKGNKMGEKTGNKGPGTNPANGLGNNVKDATMSISPHKHKFTVTAGGDLETRPVNVYVNWIIKIGDPQTGPVPGS